MNRTQIRYFNRIRAREAFMTVNEADFPAISLGGRTLAALRLVIANVETLAARKESGKISQNVVIKDDDFEKLDRSMSLIGKAARSLSDDIPGIEELYRTTGGNQSEEARLARARQFHTQSADHREQFIEAGLDEDFREQLNTLITKISAVIENTDSAQAERGGAVGALQEEIRKGNRLGTKLDNLVKIKYADDPDKLAAWLIASHLQAADSKEDEDEETPTEGNNG